MGGSRGRRGHAGAEQSPELLPDTVPVGSLAGPCLPQSRGEGGCLGGRASPREPAVCRRAGLFIA